MCAQQLGQVHVFNRSQNRYEYSRKGNMDVCDRQTRMLRGSHLHLGVEASLSNALRIIRPCMRKAEVGTGRHSVCGLHTSQGHAYTSVLSDQEEVSAVSLVF